MSMKNWLVRRRGREGCSAPQGAWLRHFGPWFSVISAIIPHPPCFVVLAINSLVSFTFVHNSLSSHFEQTWQPKSCSKSTVVIDYFIRSLDDDFFKKIDIPFLLNGFSLGSDFWHTVKAISKSLNWFKMYVTPGWGIPNGFHQVGSTTNRANPSLSFCKAIEPKQC